MLKFEKKVVNCSSVQLHFKQLQVNSSPLSFDTYPFVCFFILYNIICNKYNFPGYYCSLFLAGHRWRFLFKCFLFCFQIISFIYLWLCCAGSSLLCGLFSSHGKWGLLSSCSPWASRCGSFSLQSASSRAHRL